MRKPKFGKVNWSSMVLANGSPVHGHHYHMLMDLLTYADATKGASSLKLGCVDKCLKEGRTRTQSSDYSCHTSPSYVRWGPH